MATGLGLSAIWGGATYLAWRLTQRKKLPKVIGYAGAAFGAWRTFMTLRETVALSGAVAAIEAAPPQASPAPDVWALPI